MNVLCAISRKSHRSCANRELQGAEPVMRLENGTTVRRALFEHCPIKHNFRTTWNKKTQSYLRAYFLCEGMKIFVTAARTNMKCEAASVQLCILLRLLKLLELECILSILEIPAKGCRACERSTERSQSPAGLVGMWWKRGK